MDAPDSSLHDSISTRPNVETQPDKMSAFATTWDAKDTTHLLPDNLPLSRVQRAYDRRPQSPFSRKKVRFGKVWKRNGDTSTSTTAGSIFGASSHLTAIGMESPVKAVKKMRVNDGEVVSNWDGRGSPANRRIVTRSNREVEPLLELEEDAEGAPQSQLAEEEVLKVEVHNEDGSIEEIALEEELAQDDWEDESITEEAVWDATLMHLGEVGEEEEYRTERDEDVSTSTSKDPEREKEEDPGETETAEEYAARRSDFRSGEAGDLVEQEETMSPEATAEAEATDNLAHTEGQVASIPDGFISPIKECRRRPISEVRRQSAANRRKTLPMNFAAQRAAAEMDSSDAHGTAQLVPEAPQSSDESAAEQLAMHDEGVQTTPQTQSELQEESADHEQQSVDGDNAWEDVEQEEPSTLMLGPRAVTPEPTEQMDWVDTAENTPVTPPQTATNTMLERVTELISPSKMPSSPVPSVLGQHPRLPLRRSPRRQTSSPLKRETANKSAERSHLIAFTPLKMATTTTLAEQEAMQPGSHVIDDSRLAAKDDTDEDAMPALTRSSSAPPEEPQMSPYKPRQPRISDDTALLQAFLSRAAESRNGRRASLVATRESLENRRNSDTVRQALASPAAGATPVDVLADLDPNSPAPRKQTMSAELPQLDSKLLSAHDEDDSAAPASPTKKTSRRSGRPKKKPETLSPATYNGPTKISVKGSADSVVLKKSEAQELAQRTKANTRKNKGGSVLPPLRLTKMAKEGNEDVEGAEQIISMADKPGRRGIKWAETLVSYYQADSEPEISTMMDELTDDPAPAPGEQPDEANIDVPAPIPASETPSKPKLRRLKPPRTASTPAKAAPPVVEMPETAPPEQTRPKAKKTSRIATPAKPKVATAASSLPDEGGNQASAAKKPTTSRKTTSRLPAPASAGKENSLIASPPKKRTKAPPTPAASSAKAFVPRLELSKSIPAPEKRQTDNADAPGIASPAKKGVRPSVLFGQENAAPSKEDLPPSLGSPAKKRTRRG